MKDFESIISASERIVILVESGFGNLGQEAVVAGILNEIRDINPDTEITFNSNDPRASEEIHLQNHGSGIENKKRNTRFVKSGSLRIMWEIIRSDCVIIGGDEISSESLDKYYRNVFSYFQGKFRIYSGFFADLMKKDIVIYKIGFYSMQRSFPKKIFLGLMRHAKYISVRDEASKRFILDKSNAFCSFEKYHGKPFRIHVSRDPAYSISNCGKSSQKKQEMTSEDLIPQSRIPQDISQHPERKKVIGKSIGINLAYYFDNKTRKKIFGYVYDSIRKGGFKKIYLFSFGNHKGINTENDRIIIDEFIRFLKRKSPGIELWKYDSCNPYHIDDKLKSIDCFIGMRYHPAILCSARKIPCTIIVSNSKTMNMSVKGIKKIGLNEI